jgi:TolB-like protein
VIRLPKGSYVPQFDRPALPDSPVTPGADASGGRRAPLWLALVAGSVLLLFLAVRHFTAPAAPADPAVAVLPFVPVPDTPENRAVAEALTAAVTDALVRNGAVGVVPRRKVAAVLATQTVQEAAGQLGAEWLVEARVIAGEDLVQLEIRISNAARNRKVWVHDYSGNLRETTAIAAEAARGVTEALSRDQHVPAR